MVYDLLTAGILLVAFAIGARKGLGPQLALLASLGALTVLVPASALVAPVLGLPPGLDWFAALGLLYAACSLAIYGLAALYRRAVKRCGLEAWDRHLGAILGLAQGCCFCAVMTIAALLVSGEARPALTRSVTGRIVGRALHAGRPLVPADMRGTLLEPFEKR